MQTNYLIIPGYGGSGEEHWQSYFERNLANCKRVQQKSWDKPLCKDWVTNINEAVNQYDPKSLILITHSLGCIALAHWARQYGQKIKGAMIVAPPDIENPWQELGLESFTPIPLLKLPFQSVVVTSTNDHWASLERTQDFAAHWGSKLINIGEAGHINTASNYGTWAEGLNILKNEL
jgi:uncharacterized protein